MEMDRGEIVRSYRDARNKREQISILADLNQCSIARIKDELLSGGVKPQELPRARQRKKDEEAPSNVTETVKEKCENNEETSEEKRDGNTKEGFKASELPEEPEPVVLMKAMAVCKEVRVDLYCEMLRVYAEYLREENDRLAERVAYNSGQAIRAERIATETGWTA